MLFFSAPRVGNGDGALALEIFTFLRVTGTTAHIHAADFAGPPLFTGDTMHLYLADCRGDKTNTRYPHELNVENVTDLRQAVQRDHMAAKMRGAYRKGENFIEADCIMFDLDNAHSDDPDTWQTEGDLFETFPVSFYMVQSRNYMKPKDGKEPREKWHVYMPLRTPITDPEAYAHLMNDMLALYPFIDANAKDTARFFYGVETPHGTYQDEDTCIDEYLASMGADVLRELQTVAISEYIERVQDGTYHNSKETRDVIKDVCEFLGVRNPLAATPSPASSYNTPRAEGELVPHGHRYGYIKGRIEELCNVMHNRASAESVLAMIETDARENCVDMDEVSPEQFRKEYLPYIKKLLAREAETDADPDFWKKGMAEWRKVHPSEEFPDNREAWAEVKELGHRLQEEVSEPEDTEAAGPVSDSKDEDAHIEERNTAQKEHPEKDAERQQDQQSVRAEEEAEARKEAELEQVRAEYAAMTAGAYVNKIWDLENRVPPIKTGFPTLDEVLDGGLYPGLYILGALSSLGKTTLLMQMADQIAVAGHDVIIYSLEMSKAELVTKSVSRLTAQLSAKERGQTVAEAIMDPKQLDLSGLPHAKTARALTDPNRFLQFPEEDQKLVEKAASVYAEMGARVWIDEGPRAGISTDYIRQSVERHKAITGHSPVVVVDYLQILESPDNRLSDKQKTDINVKTLRTIGRDNGVPVIAVSSLNRENYSAAISMTAFKESGAIEYSSDVLLGLQPADMRTGTNKEDERENILRVEQVKRMRVRPLELKILKQRAAAPCRAVSFNFAPAFNVFEDAGEAVADTGSFTKRKEAAQKAKEKRASTSVILEKILEQVQIMANVPEEWRGTEQSTEEG